MDFYRSIIKWSIIDICNASRKCTKHFVPERSSYIDWVLSTAVQTWHVLNANLSYDTILLSKFVLIRPYFVKTRHIKKKSEFLSYHYYYHYRFQFQIYFKVVKQWIQPIKFTYHNATKRHNSRLVQIESICGRQNTCFWKYWNLLFGKVKKHCGKGENAGNQHFLLFPLCFQKSSFSGLRGKELKAQ